MAAGRARIRPENGRQGSEKSEGSLSIGRSERELWPQSACFYLLFASLRLIGYSYDDAAIILSAISSGVSAITSISPKISGHGSLSHTLVYAPLNLQHVSIRSSSSRVRENLTRPSAPQTRPTCAPPRTTSRRRRAP